MATTGPGMTSYMKKVRGNNEAALHSQVITLKEDAAKKENALKQKDSQISELEEVITKLTQALEGKNTELENKNEKYNALDEKYKSVESEKSVCECAIAEKDELLKIAEADLTNSQNAKLGFSDKYDETYDRLRAEQAKVTVLERRLLEQEAEYEIKIDEYKAETAALKAIADDIHYKYEVMKESLDAKISEQDGKISQLLEEQKEQEVQAKALLEETKRQLEEERMSSLQTLQEQENLTRKELEDRLENDLMMLKDALDTKPGANRLSMSSLQGIKGDKDAIKRLIATMTQLQQSYKDIDELQAKLLQLEQALKVYKAQVSAQSQALGQQTGYISSLQAQLGHDGGVPQQSQPNYPMSPVKGGSNNNNNTSVNNNSSNNDEELKKLHSENGTLKDKLKQLATLSAKEVERLRTEVNTLQGKKCQCGGVIENSNNSTNSNTQQEQQPKPVQSEAKPVQQEQEQQPVQSEAKPVQQEQEQQPVQSEAKPVQQEQQERQPVQSEAKPVQQQEQEQQPVQSEAKPVQQQPASFNSTSSSPSTSQQTNDNTNTCTATSTTEGNTTQRSTARHREPSATPHAKTSSCGHNHGNNGSCSRSGSRVRDISQSKRLMGNVAGYNSANERTTNADIQALHESKSCSCYSNTSASRCAHAVLLSKRARA